MFLITKAHRYAHIFLLAVTVLALAGCSKLHDTTLDNGMRVVVKEDHRAPVVVSMVWIASVAWTSRPASPASRTSSST